MSSPYKRRKPSILRNLWVYRYLILAAFALGVLLWFIVTNREPVTVSFPFGLGSLESTSGIVILLSALTGSIVTILVLGALYALRRLKSGAAGSEEEKEAEPLSDDLPPPDYASNAPEGYERPWPRR